MTTPDPPWKQKTRPCPFYSQGRCLFADSCNFLHDVKIKAQISEDVSVLRAAPNEYNANGSSSPFTPTIGSPRRSPRLSSLLMALGTAIHQDEEDVSPSVSAFRSPVHLGYMQDEPGEMEETQETQDEEAASFVVLPSSDDQDEFLSDFIAESPAKVLHLGSEEDFSSPSSFVATLEDEDVTEVLPPSASSPHEPPLQPVADTSVVSKPSSASHVSRGSVTSHESPSPSPPADTQVTQVFRTPENRSRPRPPSSVPSELSTLLSPIEITLAPPAVYHIGQLEAHFHREDSIDSGYADGWTGPSPLALSPPERSPRRVSTLSLLSSPFGSPSRVISSPTFVPSSSAAWPAANLFNTGSAQTQSSISTLQTSTDDDLDSPSDYYLRRISQASHQEPTVEETVRPPSTPALPDEGFDESVSFELPESSESAASCLVDEQEPIPDSVQDSIPPEEVALPISDTPSPNTNSANLFDSYYANTPSVSIVSSPVITSSPRPSPRPSVFTRPRKTTPSSLNLPSSRSDALPGPSTAPLLVPVPPLSAVGSPRLSAPLSASEVEMRTPVSASSTKVPFGFRHTSRSRNSSRNSIRSPDSVTPSPRLPVGLENRSTSSSPFQDSPGLKELSRASSPHSTSSRASRLKPLRLSMTLNSSSVASSLLAFSSTPSSLTTGTTAPSSALGPSSPTVSSEYSIFNNPLLSHSQSASIPTHDHNTLILGPNRTHLDGSYQSMPHSAPISRPTSWQKFPESRRSSRTSSILLPSNRSSSLRPSSRLSERLVPLDENAEVIFNHTEDEERDDYQFEDNELDDTIRGPAISPPEQVYSRPPSVLHSPIHAIATPRPSLLFAIASDDVEEVRKVLESGEAGPNDEVGPQSALAFTLTANNLNHKMEIVKLLLAHGANPSTLRDGNHSGSSSTGGHSDFDSGRGTPSMTAVIENADPATRYYIARAEAPQTRRTSALIHRSFFRPLAKVRYDLIGQDRALEQLFRVLGMPTVSPIVVLLCGPSGHGKSLLARKFGSLLDVPTHTVNMTTLRSTHDIWRSYSMNPHEAPSTVTLSEFLLENEGKRCVVVLDEIEKTENETYLSSLLMPWELGRCSFEAGRRHIDVSKVIWLGTSNIGHDLVFEHHAARENPEEPISRESYVDLMGMLRPLVSQRLGPSLLSRVTTVLPFVPFSREEKMAIAAEALYALAGEDARSLPSATVEKLVQNAIQEYVPREGARSLYRAVSTQLLDTIY